MNKSRIIILGVAALAAIGAGYMAKNLATSDQQIAAEPIPEKPAIELAEVLVLARDVPMGEPVGEGLRWQPWPAESVNENFITRSREPEAAEELRNAIARVHLHAGEPLRRAKLINAGSSFMSAMLPPGK